MREYLHPLFMAGGGRYDHFRRGFVARALVVDQEQAAVEFDDLALSEISVTLHTSPL